MKTTPRRYRTVSATNPDRGFRLVAHIVENTRRIRISLVPVVLLSILGLAGWALWFSLDRIFNQ